VQTISRQTRTALERAISLHSGDRSFEEVLEKSLSSGGRSPAAVSSRVKEALVLLNNKKRRYFQEPTSFFFPGLPQRHFASAPGSRGMAQLKRRVRQSVKNCLRSWKKITPSKSTSRSARS
jgi:hypothetical protein